MDSDNHDDEPDENVDYLEDGQVYNRRLAEKLSLDHGFLTEIESGHMYYYDGVWQNYGQEIAEQLIETMLRKKASEHQVRETMGHLERMTYVKRDEYFDLPARYIAVENGVLNLLEGRLVSDEIGDDERKEITDNTGRIPSKVRLPVEWRPEEADPEPFLDFLGDITGNDTDKEKLLEFVGHTLYRDWVDHKALMLLGEGANGKSTFLNVLNELLGGAENVSTVPLQKITGDKFSVAQLDDKLANICADISAKALNNTGTFKMLTGEDLVFAQRKYEEPFSFRNTAKLAFSANQLPKTGDLTDAFFRRWIVIKFPHQFKGADADEHLEDKLTEPEVMQGVLKTACEALQRLHERGHFPEGGSMDDIREEWVYRADSIKAFLEDRVEQDPVGFEPRKSLHAEYENYCIDRGVPAESNRELYGKIRAEYNVSEQQERVDGEQKRGFKGIRLTDDEDDEVDESEVVDPHQAVKSVVEEMCEGNDEYVPVNDVIREAHDRYMTDPDDAENAVNALSRDGEIIKTQGPEGGVVRPL